MLSPTQPNRRERFLFLGVATAFGLLVWAILPGWPVATNDDFGYLRSVMETIQHGRPWTNDFLEPWSLSLAAVSAGIFKVTGSMYWATIVLQTAMAAVSCWLVGRIALDCGYQTIASAGLALFVLTFPTILWKQIEYTAMVVYLPCFLAALWFAGRKRWTWFFLAWAVAVASRQSAVAWLAIPVLAGVEAAIRERAFARLKVPALLVVAGAGWFLLVRSYANETHAQRYITSHLISNLSFQTVWINFRIGLWVLAMSAGCASLLFRALRRQPDQRRPGTAFRLVTVAVAVGLLAALLLPADSLVLPCEHPFFENSWAVAYLKGLVVVAAGGWLLAPPSFRWPMLGAAFAALLLTSLRAGLWDYYLVDAALLAFFAVGSGAVEPAAGAASAFRGHRLWMVLGSVLVLTLICLQVNATKTLNQSIDQKAGAGAVLEKALRAGWMQPTELSDAPLGLIAWHLLPYYLAHEGKHSADLGGFNAYVGSNAVSVMVQDLNRKELRLFRKLGAPPDPNHPFSGIHPHGWFRYARYTLERPGGSKPAQVALDPATYRYEPFPLSDAEWREFARSANAGSIPP